VLIDDRVCLERMQIAGPGWTLAMVARFLPELGRWTLVEPWKNYRCKTIINWACRNSVKLRLINRGQPNQNAFTILPHAQVLIGN